MQTIDDGAIYHMHGLAIAISCKASAVRHTAIAIASWAYGWMDRGNVPLYVWLLLHGSQCYAAAACLPPSTLARI